MIRGRAVGRGGRRIFRVSDCNEEHVCMLQMYGPFHVMYEIWGGMHWIITTVLDLSRAGSIIRHIPPLWELDCFIPRFWAYQYYFVRQLTLTSSKVTELEI